MPRQYCMGIRKMECNNMRRFQIGLAKAGSACFPLKFMMFFIFIFCNKQLNIIKEIIKILASPTSSFAPNHVTKIVR